MRRVEASEHGEPLDVLTVVEVPDDPLGDRDVRIECHAVGLNYIDLMRCRGTYPAASPFPISPGVEVAGRVVEAGAAAGGLVGQDVVACPTLPHGALAERVVVDSRFIVARPDDIDPVIAAALPVNYQTAWFGLERAGVGPGTRLLVTAAAGGVGIAATQLAAARGAWVIAAAGGSRKASACVGQGADVVIDYVNEDIVAAVQSATGGDGVAAVLDQVGGDMFVRLLDTLAFEGVIVAIGAAAGPIAPIDPMTLAARNVGVLGLSWGSTYPMRAPALVAHCYERLFALARDGAVRPVVTRVRGLDAAPRALADLAERRTVGKLVVDFGGRA